jgi:hypothetical protein
MGAGACRPSARFGGPRNRHGSLPLDLFRLVDPGSRRASLLFGRRLVEFGRSSSQGGFSTLRTAQASGTQGEIRGRNRQIADGVGRKGDNLANVRQLHGHCRFDVLFLESVLEGILEAITEWRELGLIENDRKHRCLTRMALVNDNALRDGDLEVIMMGRPLDECGNLLLGRLADLIGNQENSTKMGIVDECPEALVFVCLNRFLDPRGGRCDSRLRAQGNLQGGRTRGARFGPEVGESLSVGGRSGGGRMGVLLLGRDGNLGRTNAMNGQQR